MQPSVLVGITTRNRAAILPRALDSIRQQSYPNVTVAVIDDGSDDDSVERLRPRYPEARWIRHSTSQGYMASRNELMSTAGTDYYLSLDDDAWFLEGDEIEVAVARLEARPDVAAIAFDILSPDRPAAVPRGAPVPAATFIGCGHMLRLAAARAAGLYADSPGTYGGEEKDLSLRLADKGGDIELLPGVHVWHDKAWTNRDWYPLHRSGVCNELYLTVRRCPLPDLLYVLPYKLLSFARYWLRQPRYLRAGLAGVGQFLRHIGDAWRRRAPVRRSTFLRMTRGGRVAGN